MISPIAKTLGAASTLAIVDEKKELAIRRDEIKADKNTDVEYAQTNIKILINESIRKVPDLMELVKESQMPRMYEAAASFIKMISDLNKDLVGLSKGDSSSAKENPLPKEKQGDTNIYMGSTEDFLNRLSKHGQTYDAEKQ